MALNLGSGNDMYTIRNWGIEVTRKNGDSWKAMALLVMLVSWKKFKERNALFSEIIQ
jgi:hypothetical protein